MERSKRLQSVGTAIVFLLAVSPCRAQDVGFYETVPLPARLIPEYVPCMQQGTAYACFNKDQVTELFMLELRAKYWHAQWQAYVLTVPKKDAQIRNLELQITTHTAIELAATERADELTKQLLKATEERNNYRAKAENPPSWPLWLGGIMGVLGAGAFLGALLR